MDLVKGRAKVNSRVYTHQLRWRDEYIIFPGCTALDVTPWGERRRFSSLEKSILQSLERLYASIAQYSFLDGESRLKSSFPEESFMSVNLKNSKHALDTMEQTPISFKTVQLCSTHFRLCCSTWEQNLAPDLHKVKSYFAVPLNVTDIA